MSIATTTTTGPESKIDDDKPKVVEQPEPKPEPEGKIICGFFSVFKYFLVVVTSDMAFAMVDNVVNSIGADRKLHRTAGEFFHEYFEHGYEMCKKKTGNLLEKDVSERRYVRIHVESACLPAAYLAYKVTWSSSQNGVTINYEGV